MPELDFAALCDSARGQDGLIHALGLGVDTVVAPHVPTIHTVTLAFRLAFTSGECGRPHRVEVIFIDEDGTRLAAVWGTTETRWPGSMLPPGWPVHAAMVLEISAPLPAYGVYAFEILVNDTNVKTLGLRVVEPVAEE